MDVFSSFVDLLSSQYRTSEEYLLVALDLECYFDGGNQPDSREYDLVTLSVVSGVPKQWRRLEEEWKRKIDDHHIGFFHATEYKDRPEIMEDFAKTASTHAFVRSPFHHGLYIFSVTLPLEDFQRARKVNPRVPRNVPDILIREALYRCVEWGQKIGVRDYHLIFDQGEPYCGRIWDFKHSPKHRKEYPIVDRFALTEDQSRKYPGLQMADLFAFSHSNRKAYYQTNWHRVVRYVTQDREDLTYENLLNPVDKAIKDTARWKLPMRAATS